MSGSAGIAASAARRTLLTGLRDAARIAPALRDGLTTTGALALVGALGALIVPVALQRLLDDQILASGGPDVDAAVRLGAAAAAIAVVAALAAWQAMFRLVRAAARGLHELRVHVFHHLHAVPTLTLAAERRGALVARVTGDIDAIAQFIEWGGIGMLVGFSQLGVVATLMLVFDPLLAGAVLGIAAIYTATLVAAQRVLGRRYDRVRSRAADSLAIAGEAISGLPTIRAFAAEERVGADVGAALERQFRTESRTRLLGAALFSTSEVFAALMTIAVVAIGIGAAGTSGLTAGRVAAFLLLVTLFVAPVQLLVEILDQAQSAAAGLRRVLDVLDTPVDRRPAVPRPAPDGPLDVVVDRLTYAYPDGPEVLRAVSFTIPQGRRVAVVGRTGSGKSTLVKLLARLQDPPDRSIRLGGVPLEAIATEELRRRVAFVPQDPFLLDATIADNVRYGDLSATDAAIMDAFAALGLETWVTTLPDGLCTRVGERGSRLSSGERQLVALARAWMSDADLLILDEATSSVDPELDVRLRRAVARLSVGRTSITVAHRLATAEHADRILVLSDGRLVQDGAHADLVRVDGPYADLYARWSVASHPSPSERR